MRCLSSSTRNVSANKGIFVPVTNGDTAANANVCVGDRDLAYEPRSKRCRTQHSYDATIRDEIGKYTYSVLPRRYRVVVN